MWATEKLIKGFSEEGANVAIKLQVTHVDKPLIAVSRLTAAGHEVWFGENSGTVTNKANGKVTHFARKNNVYVLRIWVRRRSLQGAPDSRLSGGSRQ